MEAVTNMKTVASFGHDKTLISFLNAKLLIPENLVFKKSMKIGLAIGFSSFSLFCNYSIVFYVIY